MQFSAGHDVRQKIPALETLSVDGLKAWAPRGIDISISMQLHNPYTVGKLSIRRVKVCNFSRIGRNTEEQEHSEVQKKVLRRERTWSLCCGQVQTGLVMLFLHLCTDWHQTSHTH